MAISLSTTTFSTKSKCSVCISQRRESLAELRFGVFFLLNFTEIDFYPSKAALTLPFACEFALMSTR